jgi:hypothetical protein
MKNYALFFVAVAGAFSFSTFAQSSDHFLDKAKMGDTQIISNNDLAVVSYHVEERINMNFGGSVTTYDVPSLNMISTKDLGENNVRIVTPKYAKVRTKTVGVEVLKAESPKTAAVDMLKVETPIAPVVKSVAISKPIDTDIVATTERKKESVSIDVVGTYERVMEKGYKSVAMIIKVADRHFFEGDLVLAAKWYAELFNNTNDLEAVYYYRYAESLKAINQKDKANEMMKIFETKSL